MTRDTADLVRPRKAGHSRPFLFQQICGLGAQKSRVAVKELKGIMEKKMEAAIMGLYRVQGLGFKLP